MHDFRKIKEKRAGKLSFSTLCMMFFPLPRRMPLSFQRWSVLKRACNATILLNLPTDHMNQIITGQYQKNRKKLPKTDMISQLHQWAIITGFIRRKKKKRAYRLSFAGKNEYIPCLSFLLDQIKHRSFFYCTVPRRYF